MPWVGTGSLRATPAFARVQCVRSHSPAAARARDWPVSFTGHVDMQSGRPQVIVSDARAAGVPLPDATREALRKAVQDQVDQEITRMQMRVTSVTLTDGKIVVIGRRPG